MNVLKGLMSLLLGLFLLAVIFAVAVGGFLVGGVLLIIAVVVFLALGIHAVLFK